MYRLYYGLRHARLLQPDRAGVKDDFGNHEALVVEDQNLTCRTLRETQSLRFEGSGRGPGVLDFRIGDKQGLTLQNYTLGYNVGYTLGYTLCSNEKCGGRHNNRWLESALVGLFVL